MKIGLSSGPDRVGSGSWERIGSELPRRRELLLLDFADEEQ